MSSEGWLYVAGIKDLCTMQLVGWSIGMRLTVRLALERYAIFEYIEVFYNRIRRHAIIGNVAPAEFERRFHARQQLA